MQLVAAAALLTALAQEASAVEHSIIAPESNGTFRGRPTVAALRVDQAPDIDGALNDEVWQKAKPDGELIQVSTKENQQQS